MTKNKSRPMLTRAGIDIAKANSRVRMPLAPFTSLRTRPTRTTRTTRRIVGEKKNFSMNFSKTNP